MKKAIADVLRKPKNMWVYDPSGSGVGNKSIIKQFVDQFLFHEESWRSPVMPCAIFELR
jgi:hypothetical protein